MADMLDRLRRRAAEDQECADNSRAVFAALGGQMRLFETRDGAHNVYAVRLALDHKHAMEREDRHAADLREAIAEIERLRALTNTP